MPSWWRPPPKGFVKPNFDGSAFGNAGHICMGGLIHNSKGDAMLSFSGTAGYELIWWKWKLCTWAFGTLEN